MNTEEIDLLCYTLELTADHYADHGRNELNDNDRDTLPKSQCQSWNRSIKLIMMYMTGKIE